MLTMKKSLKENYDIEALIFIRVSPTVYKIKVHDSPDLMLKIVKDTELNAVYAHVNMLHIGYLLLPLINKSGQYVSTYDDQYYILTYWYEDQLVSGKPSRLKFYLNLIADMHKLSVYTIRVNDGFFKDTYDFIIEELNKAAAVIDNELYRIERLDYKSPSEWLILLNNQRFYSALAKSRENLERFKELTKDKTSIRLSLVYQNFSYDHINIKDGKLLSTHNLNFAPPIYDIKHLYDASYNESIDLSGLVDNYLTIFPLLDYEKHWLLALLLIPQITFAGIDEIEKIFQLTKSLHHIRGGEEIEKMIKKLAPDSHDEDRHQKPH